MKLPAGVHLLWCLTLLGCGPEDPRTHVVDPGNFQPGVPPSAAPEIPTVPKLPAPREDDLSKGILEAIDMDSYRVEKHAVMRLQLPDEDAEIPPVPTAGGGHKPEAELDRLSNIIRAFKDK